MRMRQTQTPAAPPTGTAAPGARASEVARPARPGVGPRTAALCQSDVSRHHTHVSQAHVGHGRVAVVERRGASTATPG